MVPTKKAKIEKGKDEKVSFYLNWKLFLWLEHKVLGSLQPKHLERQISSSISKINQQDDFWSPLSKLARTQGHGGEMCCTPLMNQGGAPFFTRRINLVKQRRRRHLFCLLPNAPTQLFSSREKVMNAKRSESATKSGSVLLAIVSINAIWICWHCFQYNTKKWNSANLLASRF